MLVHLGLGEEVREVGPARVPERVGVHPLLHAGPPGRGPQQLAHGGVVEGPVPVPLLEPDPEGGSGRRLSFLNDTNEMPQRKDL